MDPTDRVIADPNPHWLGSIRTSFRVRKFQFSALIDHKEGGQVWDGTSGALYNFGTHKDTDIRGQTFTFGKDYPYLSGAVVGPGAGTPVVIDQEWFQGLGSGFGPVSAQFMEDGTYTKLREISVAYTFDGKWVSHLIGLTSIDVRLAGRNLATWTKYKGIDPETNLTGGVFQTQGIDLFQQSADPVVRVLTGPEPLSEGDPKVNKHFKGAICAAVLALVAAGCNSFLKGGDLTTDPNNPLNATPKQLFGSVQSNLWMQQSSGSGAPDESVDAADRRCRTTDEG